MKCDVNGSIGRAVADYTGNRVLELDVIPDPGVPGVFAVRALTKPSVGGYAHVIEFLISGVPLQNVVAGDLSEVEFTAWPPTAAGV
jgi:hypothetical protein